jgi:hypothetical protein
MLPNTGEPSRMVACCCACREGLGARLLWEASEIESGMLCCSLGAVVLIWDPWWLRLVGGVAVVLRFLEMPNEGA